MASTSAGGSAAITLGERSFESISEFDRNSYEHFSLNQKKTVRDRTQDLIVRVYRLNHSATVAFSQKNLRADSSD